MLRILVLAVFSLYLRADTLPGTTISPNGGTNAPDSSLPEIYGPSADSLRTLLRDQLARVTSPALESRKAARLLLQRSGYANVLADVLQEDGLSAFLSMARMNAQVEFSISHRQLFVYVPIPPPAGASGLPPYLFTYQSSPWQIPLQDDWSIPEDPWHR